MAFFKKDKVIRKIDMASTKIMNLLRENNVYGILTLQKTSDKYITYYCKSKRKVRCIKKDDKYTFYIDLSLKGEILENSLYKDLISNPKTMNKFKAELSEQVKKQCNEFILKMQNEYEFDCLQLGQIAVAKYGRHSGVDWDEIVSNSDINVNVKIEVTSTGRGNYFVKQ